MTRPRLDDLVAATQGPQPWRRLFHVGMGGLLAGWLWMAAPPRALTASLLVALALALLAIDLIRLAVPSLNAAFFRVFRPLASPREENGVASSTWYVVGSALCAIFFPIAVVVPSILVLALADPAASYFGRRWGRRPFGTGSVEGTGVFALIAGVVLLGFVPPLTAFSTALAVALIEVIPSRLDDNLVIPLAVATVLWITGAG